MSDFHVVLNMAANRYTGDLAYYATMITLVSAMQSCNIMVSRPSKTIAQLVNILHTSLMETAPKEVQQALGDEALRAVLRDHIDKNGLTVMSVLQCIRQYDKGKQSLKGAC